MTIDGVKSGAFGCPDVLVASRGPQRAQGHDSPGRSGEPKPASIPAPDDAEDTVVIGDEANESGEQGVIRLLQEGHFKGVADVRLRINFYDELSAKAAASATPTAETGTSELVDGVTTHAQALIAAWGLDEQSLVAAQDLLAQFKTDVQTALTDSTTDGIVDTARLADALRKAFDSFSGQLVGLIPQEAASVDPVVEDGTDPSGTEGSSTDAPSVTDAPTPPTTSEETVTSELPGTADSSQTAEVPPTTDQEGATPTGAMPEVTEPAAPSAATIEPLVHFFASELTRLLGLIGDASQLPPLTSEPSGNGKAYDKFVAIYNELTGRQPEPIAEPVVEGGEDRLNLIV